MTEGSSWSKRIKFQVTAVHKPLLSVSKLADAGFDCMLGKDGGSLVDRITGEVVPIKRTGNLYVIRMWMRQDDPSFGRPGRQARLRQLKFPNDRKS